MRKIILSIMMFVSTASASFALGGGFEFILNVPVGMSIGIYDYELTDYAERMDAINGGSIRSSFARNGGIGFDIGASIQLGYMIKFTDSMGLSILAEAGYSHDTYSYISRLDKNNSYSYSFESLEFGVIPKFNIKNFAIGIGGGVKIPLAGNINTKTSLFESNTKLSSDDIKRLYEKALMPYIKVTFDYSIFFTQKTAFNIGLYLGYDFGLEPNIYTVDGAINGNRLILDEVSYSSFDVGIQVGLKFGPSTK